MPRFAPLAVAGLLLALAGCKPGTFLGQRHENFTAYYNTFYNARKMYAEGVKTIEQAQGQSIDRSVYLSIYPKPERVSNQQTFNDVIIKSADVLREHPTSKWVDDALLLIGKSYFYLENYVGAEEKFQEVISTGGALEDEARFWLARTLIAADAFDEAIQHLEFSLGMEALDRSWEPALRLVLAELHVRRQAWEEAALELERGLDRASGRTVVGRATFLLGQIYETLARYDQAVAAYARVQRHKPDYPLSYAAFVSEIRVQAAYGDATQALRLVRAMERDDKHFDNRAELAYLRGRVYQAMKQPDAAYEVYTGLLYAEDRTLNAGAVRGKTHYALGELYRDLYVDFSFASAHFDTARSALQSGARRATGGAAAVQHAPEAIVDADEQAEVFGSYSEVHERLADLDSLIRLGQMDDESFDAFILALRKKKGEELLEQRRLQAKRQAEQQFQAISSVADRANTGKVLDSFSSAATSSGDADAGFLFHKDRIRLQEGRLNFVARWGDRPRVVNWRRQDAITAAAAIADGQPADSTVISAREQLLAEMELPVVDFSAVPRDAVSRAETLDRQAQVRYELANVLFLSMEKPDSAAAWYRMVIEETADLPVAQRAYYALAEVQRALGDTLSARGLYARVLDLYPNNDFAGRVREQLGMTPVAVLEAPDSIALADAAYDRAFDRWDAGFYAEAIDGMLAAGVAYPRSDVAPRALLAVGAIYMEWAERDSLNLYALPLPDLPDSVLAAYTFLDSTRVLEPAAAPAGTPPVKPSPSKQTGSPVDTTAQAATAAAPDTTIQNAPPADSLSRFDSSVAAPPTPSVLTPQERMAEIRPPWKPVRIDKVYAAIVDKHPRTAYADVANRRLKAIAEMRPEGEAREIVEQIELEARLEAMTPLERMLKGPEAIDQTAEGWVLVVASFADQERATGVMNEYTDKGFRSGVMKAPTRFRVILGHFPTLDEARAALAANKDQFPPNTWFLDLRNPR
jgi:tetratricopeptide (TPR) repeat protein